MKYLFNKIGILTIVSMLLLTMFGSFNAHAQSETSKEVKEILFNAKEESNIDEFFKKYNSKNEDKNINIKANIKEKLQEKLQGKLNENLNQDKEIVGQKATQLLRKVKLKDGTIRKEFVTNARYTIISNDEEGTTTENVTISSTSPPSDGSTNENWVGPFDDRYATAYIKAYYHTDQVEENTTVDYHINRIETWWEINKSGTFITDRQAEIRVEGVSHTAERIEEEWLKYSPTNNDVSGINAPDHWVPIYDGLSGGTSWSTVVAGGLSYDLEVSIDICPGGINP